MLAFLATNTMFLSSWSRALEKIHLRKQDTKDMFSQKKSLNWTKITTGKVEKGRMPPETMSFIPYLRCQQVI